MTELRSIVLELGLEETYKWKQACYVYQGSNILIISAFKNYCAINFFKGSLLADTGQLLVSPGENTQGGRQLRFADIQEILDQEAFIKAYVVEAIEVEKAGLKVPTQRIEAVEFTQELKEEFERDGQFQLAFERLTPGRQKAYLLHFYGAKQASTRAARINRLKVRILDGFGLNDCVCGFSKRMPSCDGSHKFKK